MTNEEVIGDEGAVSIKEALKLLPISMATLYRIMDEEGGIRTVRLGTRRAIPRREIQRYLAANLVPNDEPQTA